MADLEARVAVLEHEMAIVKERTGRHDEELANIPELIKVEFRLANSRTARLAQDVADFKTDTDLRFNKLEKKFDDLKSTVDGFPKAVGDIVREVLNERDRRRG
jgi:predicted  nucleic acid-binding Zn-ribbon protein